MKIRIWGEEREIEDTALNLINLKQTRWFILTNFGKDIDELTETEMENIKNSNPALYKRIKTYQNYVEDLDKIKEKK
jgi:hypothetical protein